LENGKSLSCGIPKVPKEVEEHSFLKAVADSELGEAWGIEGHQRDLTPVSDHSIGLPLPSRRPQNVGPGAEELRKALGLPVDVSGSEKCRLYGARHIDRRSILRMKDGIG
jgi:hypothetical protein